MTVTLYNIKTRTFIVTLHSLNSFLLYCTFSSHKICTLVKTFCTLVKKICTLVKTICTLVENFCTLVKYICTLVRAMIARGAHRARKLFQTRAVQIFQTNLQDLGDNTTVNIGLDPSF